MAKMQLFGGEKDGWDTTISPSSRPDVYYAVPNLDEDLVKKVRKAEAKQELREKLAVLAYKFDPDTSSTNHFKMVRCPELDRVSQT